MLRFLTYNVHGCIGRTRRYEPEAVLEVIRSSQADIVALQEVIDERHDRIRFIDMLHELGYAGVVHARTIDKQRGPYGIALLSRVEPSEVQEIELGGVEPRKALRFHIEHPEGALDICNTHLGLAGTERWKQIEKLSRILARADERHDDKLQVLMGDLNEWRPGSRLIRRLRKRFDWVSALPSFPSRRPIFALDRIAIRGNPTAVHFKRIDDACAVRASDHRALLAQVE
jgi:endonuclease/exonuclease/phosphatase family metal-dependent hydrolase